MNRIFVKLIVFTACTLFYSSCSKYEDVDNTFSNIILEYFEEFNPNGREFVFSLETQEQFPCKNFLIKTEVNDSGNTLEIKAKGLDRSNVCIPSLGPATRVLNLGRPEDFNKKSIIFRVNDNQHEFYFNVTPEKIEVEKKTNFGANLFLPYLSLLRIPDGYVWGYFIIRDKNDLDIASRLLTAFYEAGAIKHTLADGNYHYFEIIEGNLYFKAMETEVMAFGFKYNGDLETIASITTLTAPWIKMQIFNTLGKSISI